MGAWKFSACAIAVVLAAATVTSATMAQDTQASPVPVTVFDPGFEPYTAYGRAEAGGAVIVFDSAPLTPFRNTLSPAAWRKPIF